MADPSAVESLKAMLLHEVADFCGRLRPLLTHASQFAQAAQRNRWRAVFFGGTLRSLLVARRFYHSTGRPRDVDVVIEGVAVHELRALLHSLVSRETRFGGLQLRRDDWLFDLWPLDRTWAFTQEGGGNPEFARLPATTFLNVEAVAVDVWTEGTRERAIYSGDDQFFRAILDRVVEVNREDNPFPELCVVRSLVMTSDLGFRVGPRLADYIAARGPAISEVEFERIQYKHYGHVRIPGDRMSRWIWDVRAALDAGREHNITLVAGA